MAITSDGGLTAWAQRRPPADLLELLEVMAASGGKVIVPTVIVVESTTGRPRDDGALNHRLRHAHPDPCLIDRARQAAALRFQSARDVSAADAVVVTTAAAQPGCEVVTSDPADIEALVAAADQDVPVTRPSRCGRNDPGAGARSFEEFLAQRVQPGAVVELTYDRKQRSTPGGR